MLSSCLAVCISRLRNKAVGWAPVVRGYYAYYAVPTNIDALEAFRQAVTKS